MVRPKCIFLILFVAFQCKAVDSIPDQEKQLKKLLNESIGAEYHTTLNQSKTYGLYVQVIPSTKIGTLYTHYIVVELKSNTIVEKGKYLHGHCLWLTDSSLEILDMPDVIKENQQKSNFKKIVVIKESKI